MAGKTPDSRALNSTPDCAEEARVELTSLKFLGPGGVSLRISIHAEIAEHKIIGEMGTPGAEREWIVA